MQFCSCCTSVVKGNFAKKYEIAFIANLGIDVKTYVSTIYKTFAHIYDIYFVDVACSSGVSPCEVACVKKGGLFTLCGGERTDLCNCYFGKGKW